MRSYEKRTPFKNKSYINSMHNVDQNHKPTEPIMRKISFD